MIVRNFALLLILNLALTLAIASPATAQLAPAWMVPAAANTAGAGGTYWHSDVSLHNPHVFDLPVVVQVLPSNTTNLFVDTVTVTLYPYESLNLWDALGPDLFEIDGTGALLVYADLDPASCDPIETCDFLVTSRTYTVEPMGGTGEYGQTIPGRDLSQGVDWWTLGYAAGVISDSWFRTNIGVASWTGDWITVRADVQDEAGTIIGTQEFTIPPFGHLQSRLAYTITGGSVVFYIVSGPDDALVFPYASVVNEDTGDPSFIPALPSVVGASVDKEKPAAASRRQSPQAREARPLNRQQLSARQ